MVSLGVSGMKWNYFQMWLSLVPWLKPCFFSNAVTLVKPPKPDLLDSTSLQNVDWSKEQVADSTLARVFELVII